MNIGDNCPTVQRGGWCACTGHCLKDPKLVAEEQRQFKAEFLTRLEEKLRNGTLTVENFYE